MITAIQELEGQYRDALGNGPSRELKRNGMFPAVIYGKGKPNVNIALDLKEVSLRMHKPGFMSQLFNIQVGKDTFLALPYAVQLHPVTDTIEHIDFLHVAENSEIKVHVKFHFINQNKSLGIKRGGVLNILRREVELLCNPHNIPVSIDVDLGDMEIGQTIHMNDIVLPEGTKLAHSDNATVATLIGRADKEETAKEENEE